ncbi:furin-like protease 2 [Amphibalanus amphitrite]|uniref:furin-like protease 2 n=1 Tax=Amphibalanus amphitrite TaxID=1232801 RepID=UPI001C91741C|nr:furin-like protease 2 [Amphibalanus amphitrite]
MVAGRQWALAALSALLSACSAAAGGQPADDGHYTNQFAVEVPGGRARAERAAKEHHCSVIDTIGDLEDHYLLECHGIHKRSTEHSHHHVTKLRSSEHIIWADQQYYKKRKKRDGAGFLPSNLFQNGFPFSFGPGFGSEFNGGDGSPPRPRTQSYWKDPLFKEQWYLNGGAKDGNDMNVLPAWQQGYSGKGVVVSILDDGIQPNHPDLIDNYDPLASLDINDNDDDPTPRDDGTNRHGTRCAGEVAAMAGNTVCGVGVAPNASIGGVRMLDGGVNDYVEAKALSFRRNHIDVYSASWGPEDDGKTVDGPGPLARRAFIEGVLKGRKGRGSIFVWASGNGGQYVDNCNCDGYTNSIFTLSISSATQGGNKPWYLEECASTLATTYSSGTPLHDKSMATCDQDAALRPKHICTVSHTGTSASAPLAAGMCALALEANPSLTWRDMQYIVLMTSRPEPLSNELGWLTNGVGRKVSHKFGYGLMDAGAMVELAKRWKPVPTQHICITPMDDTPRMIPSEYGGQLRVSMPVTACGDSRQAVNYLEHVQCKVTLDYVPRGNLRILLTSPSGTVTTLLFERPRDVTGSSFDRWPFMSVHFWGERPEGVWNLTIINTHTRAPKTKGVLKEWQLIFYGTETQPIQLRPRQEQFGSSSVLRPTVVDVQGRAVVDGGLCDAACRQTCHDNPSAAGCRRCRKQYKSSCVPSCPVGSYFGGEQGCLRCHESCGSCTGPEPTHCTGCAPANVLVRQLGVCSSGCPEGYFNEGGACEPCRPDCASCDAGRCTRCGPRLLLHDGQCWPACPERTFQLSQRCEPCAAGCESCLGPAASDCLRCQPGLAPHRGRCVAVCSGGRPCAT